MAGDEFAPRLDMIETEWTMLRNAHQGTSVSGGSAKNALVLRYSPAIRNYLRAATQNELIADELSQDFIVRLLQGDFAGADPNRGRFRDLIKVAVKNMARNHWSKENRRKGVDYDVGLLEQVDSSTNEDTEWVGCWRENVMQIAWSRLEEYQDSNDGNMYFTALKLRADQTDADSTKLAAMLSEEFGTEIQAATYRQNLRRARIRFAEYLVEEVANGIDSANTDSVYDELINLDLYEQIKGVLPASWQRANE